MISSFLFSSLSPPHFKVDFLLVRNYRTGAGREPFSPLLLEFLHLDSFAGTLLVLFPPSRRVGSTSCDDAHHAGQEFGRDPPFSFFSLFFSFSVPRCWRWWKMTPPSSLFPHSSST